MRADSKPTYADMLEFNTLPTPQSWMLANSPVWPDPEENDPAKQGSQAAEADAPAEADEPQTFS